MRIKQAIARLERRAGVSRAQSRASDVRAEIAEMNDLFGRDPEAAALAMELGERLSGCAYRFPGRPSPFEDLHIETISARLDAKVEEHRRRQTLGGR